MTSTHAAEVQSQSRDIRSEWTAASCAHWSRLAGVLGQQKRLMLLDLVASFCKTAMCSRKVAGYCYQVRSQLRFRCCLQLFTIQHNMYNTEYLKDNINPLKFEPSVAGVSAFLRKSSGGAPPGLLSVLGSAPSSIKRVL